MAWRIIAAWAAAGLLVACSEDGGGGAADPDGEEDGGADSGPDGLPPPAIALDGDTAALTEDSRAAVAMAPAWLRHDLALSLRQQHDDRADELAAEILGAAEPRFVDEIAFAVAHVSPEQLEDEEFYPELLSLNAALVYEHDAALDYVELVESGEAGVDDDYWTTARYAFWHKGAIIEREIPRDVYYWYVVHPVMEDESPWFIDAWAPCASSSLECAATPDDGDFWREFLFDLADDACDEDGMCPTLDGWLPGVDVTWNGRTGGNADGAIQQIVELMRYQPVEGTPWFSFGAYGERSIQPNRIYGLGRGNCGEWADMTTAMARTALIPNANASPASWDHTWNSFYDGGVWIEWEPVNYWIDFEYNAPYSNYMARGDGFIVLQTPDYTDDTFTMRLEILDSEGAPVPGAGVSIYTPIEGSDYWSYAGEAPTGADGVAEFEVVAEKQYAMRADTPLGSWPTSSTQITYASQGVPAGETDFQSYNLEVALPPALPATEVVVDGAPTSTLSISLASTEGRYTTFGRRFLKTYTEPGPAPELQILVVDAANLALLEDDQPFEAARAVSAAGDADVEVDLPLDRPWYAVLSNAREVSRAALGRIAVDVAPLGEGAFSSDPVAYDADYELLGGGRLVVSVTPAE